MSSTTSERDVRSPAQIRTWRAYREAAVAVLKSQFRDPIDYISIARRDKGQLGRAKAARSSAQVAARNWIRKTRRAIRYRATHGATAQGGGLSAPDRQEMSRRLRRSAWRQLMICMAPFALYDGMWPRVMPPSKADRFLESDYPFALRLGTEVYGADSPNWLASTIVKVHSLLAKPENWRAVRMLAQKLLARGRLSGDEVEELLTRARPRSQGHPEASS
jgi:hypothetical protein